MILIGESQKLSLPPFLTRNHERGGVISTEVVLRKPDSDKETADSGIYAASKDLLDAIKSSDIKRISAALKAAFEICDSSSYQEDSQSEDSQE